MTWRVSVSPNVHFLAVQNSSIRDLVTQSLNDSLTQDFTNWHSKSDPRDLWPLRHLIRMMEKHDLTIVGILTTLTFFDIVDSFWQFNNLTIMKILTFFGHFANFGYFWHFLKFFEKKDRDARPAPPRLVRVPNPLPLPKEVRRGTCLPSTASSHVLVSNFSD